MSCKKCKGKNNSCDNSDNKGLRQAIADMKLEIAKLKLQVNKCCGEAPYDTPTITDFSLNVNNIVGNQTLSLSQATFTLTNGQNIVPNSLAIHFVNDGTEIASGLGLVSPLSFGPVSLNVTEGNTYYWRASITDTNGDIHYSNTYSINVTVAPISRSMYVGFSDMTPQAFQDLTVPEIFELGTEEPHVIQGTVNRTFNINQEKTIHYLLIPEDEMDLIKSEYGTVLITTLWDNAIQDGSYFPRVGGPIRGTYNGKTYRLFFCYVPTVFSEPIRITVKNK